MHTCTLFKKTFHVFMISDLDLTFINFFGICFILFLFRNNGDDLLKYFEFNAPTR